MKKIPRLFTAISVLLAAGIFLADIFIPTGVADGMLYVVLVLVGLLSGNRQRSGLEIRQCHHRSYQPGTER